MASRRNAVLARALCLVVPAAVGCARHSESSRPTGSSAASAPTARALTSARLSTPTAFELVASATGATFVWASVDRGATRIQKLELDAAGIGGPSTDRVLPESAFAGEVSDLAASRVGSRLALAWLERRGAKTSVRAAWAGQTLAPFELGAAWGGPRTARGNVVVAARGDKALVFARGAESECIEAGQSGCFAFGFHELEAERAVETGLPMSVPVPCSEHSAALVVVGSRFHYGVCTEKEKRSVTTMFSIQHDPEYARADSLLEGCTPAGTFVWRNAAWLVGDCPAGRRAARIGDDPPESLDLHGARLECRSGHMRIRTPGLDLALEEPRSGLAPLLPDDVAPAGSRAAWAGGALVVASNDGSDVHAARRTCDGDRIEVEQGFTLRAPAAQ